MSDADMLEDLFSEEELALMNAAEGLMAEVKTASERVIELEKQAKELSRMIAEGTERERALRMRVMTLTRQLEAAGIKPSA